MRANDWLNLALSDSNPDDEENALTELMVELVYG